MVKRVACHSLELLSDKGQIRFLSHTKKHLVKAADRFQPCVIQRMLGAHLMHPIHCVISTMIKIHVLTHLECTVADKLNISIILLPVISRLN